MTLKNEWLFISAKIVAVVGMIFAVAVGISDKIGTTEQGVCVLLSFGLMALAELWEINQKIDNITITHKIEIEAEVNENDMGTGGGEQA